MTNYTRLLSNLEELQLNRIKDNLDEHIGRVNNKELDYIESLHELTNLEIQAEQMFNLKRYTESITKYTESKQIFETLKSSGDFDDQTNKIEYLSQKISKVEGYLYEQQGDEEYKKKNWQESMKKYQMSLDDMKLVGESNEIQKRLEKKLKKATSKANKKWWQFWK